MRAEINSRHQTSKRRGTEAYGSPHFRSQVQGVRAARHCYLTGTAPVALLLNAGFNVRINQRIPCSRLRWSRHGTIWGRHWL